MAGKLSQGLKQIQGLVMTPQLQQAIKMLTLTHTEMTEMISEEMVENPVLEEMDGQSGEGNLEYKSERIEAQNKEATAENFDESMMIKEEGFDWNAYLENYNNSSSSNPPKMVTGKDIESSNYENIAASESKSLAEYLEWQFRMQESISQEELEVAQFIIYNINNDGYLSINFDEVIKEVNRDREFCHKVWEKVKALDPIGCGSVDLIDCLLVQARASGESSPFLEEIIKNHLVDIQNRNYEGIATLHSVNIKTVVATLEILKDFHPRPGRLISFDETHYILPDVFVTKIGGSEFSVRLNDEGVPRLKISQVYKDILKKGLNSTEENNFIQEKLRSAVWLMKSIQSRQETIKKVSQAILRRQNDFFQSGSPETLKPMILKDIAEEIGMHESTISRVVNGKYMHTPMGLFELRYFFSIGLGGKDGGVEISSEVLRLKVKSLIEKEDSKRPLSDQKIADLLTIEDVKVARRTVAKYREGMGILSSSKRKTKI